jgi:predicted porin
MNKKLLAAAITAALAAPMAAQADVSVYGRADLSIDHVDNGNGTTARTTIGDDRGDTRLGFRLSEDLGGGLKALGEFEFAPYLADAAPSAKGTNFYSRQTWAGLKGGFGQVEIGTILQPYKYYGGVNYDAFVGTIGEARAGDGGMLKSAFGQGGYLANMLAYRNHFGSVDFALAYSPDDSNDTSNLYPGSKGDMQAAVKFGFSGGEFGLAYSKNDTIGDVTSPTTTDGQTNTKAFGKYGFGAFTFLAQWEKSKTNGATNSLGEGSTIANDDVDVKFLAVQYKMGMNTLALQLGKTKFDNTISDVNYFALGGVHNFSKNTKVYLAYRTTKQDAWGTAAQVDIKGYALGLVESF